MIPFINFRFCRLQTSQNNGQEPWESQLLTHAECLTHVRCFAPVANMISHEVQQQKQLRNTWVTHCTTRLVPVWWLWRFGGLSRWFDVKRSRCWCHGPPFARCAQHPQPAAAARSWSRRRACPAGTPRPAAVSRWLPNAEPLWTWGDCHAMDLGSANWAPAISMSNSNQLQYTDTLVIVLIELSYHVVLLQFLLVVVDNHPWKSDYKTRTTRILDAEKRWLLTKKPSKFWQSWISASSTVASKGLSCATSAPWWGPGIEEMPKVTNFLQRVRRIISYHFMSYHIISYHVISFHVMSCHVISFHKYLQPRSKESWKQPFPGTVIDTIGTCTGQGHGRGQGRRMKSIRFSREESWCRTTHQDKPKSWAWVWHHHKNLNVTMMLLSFHDML